MICDLGSSCLFQNLTHLQVLPEIVPELQVFLLALLLDLGEHVNTLTDQPLVDDG